jgi:hypothetical protein
MYRGIAIADPALDWDKESTVKFDLLGYVTSDASIIRVPCSEYQHHNEAIRGRTLLQEPDDNDHNNDMLAHHLDRGAK